MKILGETILMQRQEIEQFFIMALQNCKKQIDGEGQQALSDGKSKESRNYGEKVDIE